jgi:hypothetical protein
MRNNKNRHIQDTSKQTRQTKQDKNKQASEAIIQA